MTSSTSVRLAVWIDLLDVQTVVFQKLLALMMDRPVLELIVAHSKQRSDQLLQYQIKNDWLTTELGSVYYTL